MSPRTVQIMEGDRVTAFSIANPKLKLDEYKGLPVMRTASAGGGGLDTSFPWGPVPGPDGSSSVAFDKRILEGEAAQQYAHDLAEHLGAIVVEPPEASEAEPV